MKIRLLYTLIGLALLLAEGCGHREVTDQNGKKPVPTTKGTLLTKADEHQIDTMQVRFAELHPVSEPEQTTEVEYYIPSWNLTVPGLKTPESLKTGQKENGITTLSSYPLNRKDDFPHTQRDDLPAAYIMAEFDNDIFDNTDYYFTNGIKLGFYHPVLVSSPLSRALLPDLKNSMSYYGLVFVQNMYTPREIEQEEIQYGDRPFAAYLYIGHLKVNCSPERKLRLTSEFDLGIIGSAALGSFVQGTIHEHEPVGWKNQVQNDLLMNYAVTLEKGLISSRWLEAGFSAGIQAGTLYNNISSGVFLVAGKTNGYFRTPFQSTKGGQPLKNRIRYYFSIHALSRFVAYDATLQGGILNGGSIYSIPSSGIERFVLLGSAGIGLGIGRFSLEANQAYLSPEFRGGKPHLWLGIRSILSL